MKRHRRCNRRCGRGSHGQPVSVCSMVFVVTSAGRFVALFARILVHCRFLQEQHNADQVVHLHVGIVRQTRSSGHTRHHVRAARPEFDPDRIVGRGDGCVCRKSVGSSVPVSATWRAEDRKARGRTEEGWRGDRGRGSNCRLLSAGHGGSRPSQARAASTLM